MASMTPQQLARLSPEFLAEDRSHILLRVSVALIVLQTIFFALFVASRLTVRSSLGTETWFLMPAAYIFCLGQCVLLIIFYRDGGAGRHVAYWALTDPNRIVTFLKLNTAMEIFYGLCITFPKLAIIAVYLRIFVHKSVRQATWLTGLLIILTGLADLILCFAMCQPYEYNWDKTINGHCGNIMASYRFVSVPNIVSDVAILALPASTLYKLQVSLAKKIGLFITFLVGSLGIITAILRLVNFSTVEFFSDVTYLCINTLTWTVVESSAYLIFAILPGLRPLLRYLFEGGHISKNFSTLTSRLLGRSHSQGNSTSQKNQDQPSYGLTLVHRNPGFSTKSSAVGTERSGFVRLEERSLYHAPSRPEDSKLHTHNCVATNSGEAANGVANGSID